MTNQFFSITNIFRDASAPARFFVVVFITFSCFLILSFVAILLSIPIFNLNFAEINNLIKNSSLSTDTNVFKYFQATQSIALFIVPAIILNYLLFDSPQRFISNRNRLHFTSVFIIISIMLFSLPVIDTLAHWNSMIKLPFQIEIELLRLENEASGLTNRLLSGSSTLQLLVNILIIALIPALGEEFMFRGIIQNIFHEWTKNIHLAIIFSAILFSAIHLQFYGFIPRFILGTFFGYLFYWGRNIWLPVLAHFLNNFIAIFVHYLAVNNSYELPVYLNNSGKISGVILFISVIGVFVLVLLLRKSFPQHSAHIRR